MRQSDDVSRLHTAKSCTHTSRQQVFTLQTLWNLSPRRTREIGLGVSRPHPSWITLSSTWSVTWPPREELALYPQHRLHPRWLQPASSWYRRCWDYSLALLQVLRGTLRRHWHRRGPVSLYNRSESFCSAGFLENQQNQ